MPRVIGIDPGTVSIDLCGLDDGRLFLDRSWPTAEALADPARFVAELEAAGPLELVAGPSGDGLPPTRWRPPRPGAGAGALRPAGRAPAQRGAPPHRARAPQSEPGGHGHGGEGVRG